MYMWKGEEKIFSMTLDSLVFVCQRIPRICEALAQSGFTNTSDLRRVSLSLEAACFDARKLMWQMNLLRGPPPKKPRESPIAALRKKPKLAPKVEESSDESISSDE